MDTKTIVTIGAVVGALVTVAGAYSAIAKLGLPVFMSDLMEFGKGYDTKISTLTRTAGDTRTRAIESQLQLNTLARDALRKEKLDREIQLSDQAEKFSPATRSIIQQRLNDVSDKIEEVTRERTKLIKEKEQPD